MQVHYLAIEEVAGQEKPAQIVIALPDLLTLSIQGYSGWTQGGYPLPGGGNRLPASAPVTREHQEAALGKAADNLHSDIMQLSHSASRTVKHLAF
jgi:hypothetical protein